MLSRLPSSKYSIPLIGAAAAWGIATPISKRAVAEMPPLTLLPIQLGTSLIAFAIVMLW